MKYELHGYQEKAAEKIIRNLLAAARDYDEMERLTAICLSAPTGSGKTVIATAVVESALDGNESTPGIESATFLWVTDDPSLNEQTRRKMMAASSDLHSSRLITVEQDFDQEFLQEGKVYFLNTQKLSSGYPLNEGARDGREYTFWQTLENTVKARPHGLVLIVDEAHRGMRQNKDRDSIVSKLINGKDGSIPVPVVWGISATPDRFVSTMTAKGRATVVEPVDIASVRESGLLKDRITLAYTGGQKETETTLLRHGVDKVLSFDRLWAAYAKKEGIPPVHPALVIQVSDNSSDTELGTIVDTVLDAWPGIHAENIIHTMQSHRAQTAGRHQIAYLAPELIQDASDVRVVLCKTAITTGWDCPRAEVLVSLRVAKDQDLITQLIGRMVRTPLARKVFSDEVLNTVHCVLPKFDEEAVEAVAKRIESGDDSSVAPGTEVVRDPVVVSRNPGVSDLQVAVITSVPSYVIPRKIHRSQSARLMALAALLSREYNGRIPKHDATKAALHAMVAELDLRRQLLEESGDFADALEAVENAEIHERAVGVAGSIVNANSGSTMVALDRRGLDVLMAGARRAFPEGVAQEYIRRATAADETLLIDSMVEVIALSRDDAAARKVQTRAAELTSEWIDQFSAFFQRNAGEEARAAFDRILAETDRPQRKMFTIPSEAIVDNCSETYPNHVLSEQKGQYPAKLKSWERHVLKVEMDAGMDCWYRNPSNGGESITIPYKKDGIVKGMHPDFVIVNTVGASIRPSIVDPHSFHLSDALPKLKGLAEYALEHQSMFQRIQPVILDGADYRTINLHDEQKARDVLSDVETSVVELFKKHGVMYR